jgi:hypothetical protein
MTMMPKVTEIKKGPNDKPTKKVVEKVADKKMGVDKKYGTDKKK